MQHIIRASRSDILGMVSSFTSTSRLVTLVCVLTLLSGNSEGAEPAGAEEQLAGKIVSATGPKTMTVEVFNRSSLSAATTDDIRRNLLTQLAVPGCTVSSARTRRRSTCE